jgi:histidyl-tRNA synthetase
MKYTIPPGVFDILPNDPKDTWKNSSIWNHVEEVIRRTAIDFGFQEIRTPLFERTELFQRGVGETSDIVSKEMYTFTDKGDRSMSLRPEGTAPVIRSFIENQLHQNSQIHKLFYIAPMFRYERAQAGRYRQHHQFGIEAIGNGSPEQDVEIIDLLWTLYHRLGLKNLVLNLNSIGTPACRMAYKIALQDYLRSSFDHLSKDSQTRFEINPLRILDSKDLQDRKILENAPSILDFLDDECKKHFQEVQKLLGQLKIPYKINSHLVRGLDYYNKTVFEVVAGDLGAQNSIGGGGRYDGLIKQLGGPDLPSMGFGTGLERIIQTLIKQESSLPETIGPTLFIIPLGDEAKSACFSILHDLRQQNISAQMDFNSKKLSKSMQLANDLKAKFVIVVGDNELKTGIVEIKEMSTGEISTAPLYSLPHILKIDTKGEIFVKLWKELAQPFDQANEADFFLKRLNKSLNSTQTVITELESVTNKLKGLL